MKIILQKDTRGLGKKGEVIDVADGYAQNSLIPNGIGKAATPAALNKLKSQQAAKQEKNKKNEAQAKLNLAQLQGKTLMIKERVSEKGTLYHSIGNKDLIKAISEQYSISIDENYFDEKHSLKEVGDYLIKLEAYSKTADLAVHIEAKNK